MTLDVGDRRSPTNGTRVCRSSRNPQPVVRRSRMSSSESKSSTGSMKSQDSRSLTHGVHLHPGSAPASRTGSFRDRPSSGDSSRCSPSRITSTNSNIESNTSSVNMNSYKCSVNNNNERVSDSVSMGPRQSSMPSVAETFLRVPNSDDTKDNRMRRVRSFKTTSKGLVVNRGDSFKKKSIHTAVSTGSAITDSRPQKIHSNQHQSNVNNELFESEPAIIPTYYRVIMMGAAGCGKSSMTQQFMTSDYVGDNDEHHETLENTVAVLLDGEESTIQFIDPPSRNVILEGLEELLDAYVVVFAINDHGSFKCAKELVRYLRVDHGTDRVIVLVANKIDLVRKRKVGADEARLVAETYDCKYTEISAALNHYVDELLVGILTQIRLHMRIPFTTISFPGKEHKSDDRKEKRRPLKGPRGFFSRLFRRSGRKKMKPCENLYTL